MQSIFIIQCCCKTCFKCSKHYSPTQAASSFLIQPSLQSWQSLLLEPVQVLQAVWQAEMIENHNVSYAERFQYELMLTHFQRKTYLGFTRKKSYFSSLSLVFTRLKVVFVEISFTKVQLCPTKSTGSHSSENNTP